MKKYWAIARAELLDALQEKGEVFIWMLLGIIPIFVMGSVWLNSYRQVTALNLSQLVSYYIVAVALGWITEFWFDEYLHDEIRTGEFSRFLIRPLRFPLAFIFQNLGRKLFSIPVFLLPAFIVITRVFHQHLVLPEKMSVLLFAVSVVIAYGIRYALSTLAAAGGFWWEQAGALVHLRWILEVIAGGYMLPISLYPDWLRIIPRALPFQYIYYYPVSIFTGAIGLNEALTSIGFGAIWLVVLIGLSEYVWRSGVKHYTGVGG